jgi:hypothetical protein
MTAPASGFDPRPELRDLAHEHFGMARLYAAIAQDYLALDDDCGAEYAARKFVAHAKFAAARLREVIDANTAARVEAHLADIESEGEDAAA